MGHVRRVVYSHPSGRNGLASSGFLTDRRHFPNTGPFSNIYKLNNVKILDIQLLLWVNSKLATFHKIISTNNVN